jgi:hypothetical protein
MRTILLLLGLIACTLSARSQAGIVGKAHSSEDKALPHATVSLYFGHYLLKTVLTDVDGIFIFDNLQPGVYTVAARSGNGRSRRVTLWVNSNGATYVNLIVTKPRSLSAQDTRASRAYLS